ncbi:S1C family serine protease [Allisonella histaminiformans]|uniref:S1C family serine protease n=2 Tax=Allisonella TaxID=209879 RepID=UPI0022E6C1D5|nr:trypsin-like peptidase domain-containing protein [Allisonella histaminiformans]
MKNNRKYINNSKGRFDKRLAVILLAAILIGGVSGYKLNTHMHPAGDGQGTYTWSNDSSAPVDSTLPASRNTAVVETAKRVGPAVVGITSEVYDRDIFNRNVEVGQNVGSGVIFDKKGYIVTNNHVVGNNRQVNVALSDGQVVTGKVIGTDAVTDLAVVKIPGSDKLPVAEFGNSDSLQPGETAVAIGNPLGLEFRGTVTVGVISALNRTLDDVEQQIKLIQTDAAINPGNSGGALCTADGKVIGINSAKIAKAGVEGMGFAIPINQVKTIVSQLISNGHVTRPYLGLYGIDKTLAARNGISWDHNGGIYVYKIADGSPLDGSDIVRGDYIMQINGKATNSLSELRNVMMNYKPGDKVTITYEHSGHTRTAVVVLGEDDGK